MNRSTSTKEERSLRQPSRHAYSRALQPSGSSDLPPNDQLLHKAHTITGINIPTRCTTGLAFEAVEGEDAILPSPASEDANLSARLKLPTHSSGALALPRPTLLRALLESYNTAVFHHCPVLDLSVLQDPQEAVMPALAGCLLGYYTRRDASGMDAAAELHEEIKTHLAADHETDVVRLLQTICLISQWSGKPVASMGLGGPGHWLAVGLRLALANGLHHEQSYADRREASTLRRIFWYLHVSPHEPGAGKTVGCRSTAMTLLTIMRA